MKKLITKDRVITSLGVRRISYVVCPSALDSSLERKTRTQLILAIVGG